MVVSSCLSYFYANIGNISVKGLILSAYLNMIWVGCCWETDMLLKGFET